MRELISQSNIASAFDARCDEKSILSKTYQ